MTMPLKNGPTHIFFFIETIIHLLIYHKSVTLDDVVVCSSKKRSMCLLCIMQEVGGKGLGYSFNYITPLGPAEHVEFSFSPSVQIRATSISTDEV